MLFFSMTILLVLVLTLSELIAICVRLGSVFRAAAAPVVFGSENLQRTDVDWDDCIWSCHLWYAMSLMEALVCRRLGGMIVSVCGLAVPAFAAASASSLPGMPM